MNRIAIAIGTNIKSQSSEGFSHEDLFVSAICFKKLNFSDYTLPHPPEKARFPEIKLKNKTF